MAAATPAPSVPGWSAAGGTTITVAAGDSVPVLARRYGVPEQALLAANGLPKGAALAPGRTVVIPAYTYGGKTAAAPASPAAAPTQTARAATIYEVKPGDSLGRIANDHGMRSAELAAANGIDPAQGIRIGQKLKIPAVGAAPTRVAMIDMGTATDAAPLGVIPKPMTAPKPPHQTAATPTLTKPVSNGAPGTATAPVQPAKPTQVASIAPQTAPVRPAPVAAAPAPAANVASTPVDAADDAAATAASAGRCAAG